MVLYYCYLTFSRKKDAYYSMTLDEAIEHAKERANQDCTECAKEHKQLAEWLVELKKLRQRKDG